ncbi:MAG: hypothetical protein IT569_07900 [Leptospiraceae bacterium]|nr:hypothetical protein [Leptospiraceae bacterium]
MKTIFLILAFVILQNPAFADSKKKIDYREFLNLSEEEIYPRISRLTKEEAATLVTQIRKDARKSYPEIDKFYLLISHIESIKAISEEESRLKSLNFVYILALALFVGLLGYALFYQRKSIEEVNRLLK